MTARLTQRIAGVVLRGRYVDREALDALLARAEAAAEATPDTSQPAPDQVIRRDEEPEGALQ